MHTLKLWRTFLEGKDNFRRNGWLTFATISVITLSLFIVSLSLLIGITTQSILQNMRGKVNVSVSFNPDVKEERIMEIKDELSKFKKEIASVEYISRDDALKQFLSDSGNDPIITKAIEEIGENPLLASLVIKAVTAEDYPLIAEQIKNSAFQNDVSRINYEKNKKIFDRLEHINKTIKSAGFAMGALFIFVAILITFNAIRITIYSHRQEFEVKRLVGASNLYVKMPFVFEGALYGLIAALVTVALISGVAYYVSPFMQGAVSQGNFMRLYLDYFLYILSGVILLGISLGVVSSAIAIRRYLKT